MLCVCVWHIRFIGGRSPFSLLLPSCAQEQHSLQLFLGNPKYPKQLIINTLREGVKAIPDHLEVRAACRNNLLGKMEALKSTVLACVAGLPGSGAAVEKLRGRSEASPHNRNGCFRTRNLGRSGQHR